MTWWLWTIVAAIGTLYVALLVALCRMADLADRLALAHARARRPDEAVRLR